MYIQVANFHAATANRTSFTSNFFDQSITVVHVYNFKYQLTRLNQHRGETRGSLVRIIKQHSGRSDGR